MQEFEHLEAVHPSCHYEQRCPERVEQAPASIQRVFVVDTSEVNNEAIRRFEQHCLNAVGADWNNVDAARPPLANVTEPT
jgi:hypothetical protein